MTTTPSTSSSDKYVRVVSFDTMTDKDLPDYCFTLRAKTPDYRRTRRSRTFLVATDLASYSDHALHWAINDVMDDGDELIVLRVVSVDMNDKKSVVEATLKREERQAREDATKVMDRIMATGNEDNKISVIIEFVIGKVQSTIQHMITMYQPSLLIVGTRGLSEFQGMLLGSVSKYCLQHSPIPVVVVRPQDSVNKQLRAINESGKKNQKKGSRKKRTSRLSGFFSRSTSPSPAASENESSDDDNVDKRKLSATSQQMLQLNVD
ncbi:uncharacterized protein BX664DRAFT_334860 [Halteromyces radiatus]|uniref:uncharacterized protein n=1 Tax=Halteromyces radiatus TaxID=101107 RepID=UPI00221E40CE|nr:uncharacterized protein BX664DRAFT_334860 [Halteromyces radiatus]KAI8086078.1 hypothetical protein BX664DRAFT_334860 [Halteromyces radiatus]